MRPCGLRPKPAITYVWDAENRLTEVRPTFPAVTAAAKKVVFAYDYMNRRVRKRVYNWNSSGGGSGAWETTPCLDRRFVYDGWLLLLELDGLSTPTTNAIVRKYTWGLDLSGLNGNQSASGLRDAGGISGLLAVEQLALPAQCGQTALSAKSYWYFYDGNGNVGQLIEPADDAGLSPPQAWAASRLAAKYEYDPYGNVTAQSGAYAEANLIKFSTKYYDAELTHYYYGYRHYSPTLGRWLARDPKGEQGGALLYGYVQNRPTSLFDSLGLSPDSADNAIDPKSKVRTRLTEFEKKHKGSCHYDLIVKPALDRLMRALDNHVSSVTWEDGVNDAVTGTYSWWWNSLVFYSNVSDGTIIHELVHAYQDLESHNAGKGLGSEPDAYITEELVARYSNLWLVFERTATNGSCDRAAISNVWRSNWDRAVSIRNGIPYGYKEQSATTTSKQFEDAVSFMGIRVSCSAMRACLQKKLDRAGCKCITLTCEPNSAQPIADKCGAGLSAELPSSLR